MWDALRLGLDEAKGFSGRGFNTSLLLFTDGEPNQNPPMGIIPTLRDALSSTRQDFTISTFGFGYSIDSDLMENIARLGHGVYGYCPDCTMVGTIFINFIAASLSTLTQRAVLEIRNPKYHSKHELTLWNGSSRNVVVDLDIGESKISETTVTFSIPMTGDQFVLDCIEPIGDGNDVDRLAILEQLYRRQYIHLISNNLFTPDVGGQQADALFNEIKALPQTTPLIDSLARDLVDPHPNHGQVSKAFQPAFFQKWGKDYLRSHMLFHIAEQCGNFKDNSLQGYGSAQFAEYRAMANTAFLNLPALIGRTCRGRAVVAPGSAYSAPTSPPASVDMNRFYDYDGGCFDGNAMISLANGGKRVRDVVKGDVLVGGGIVECLIEQVVNEECEAVVLNGVAFTPFHPVEAAGEWVFPRDVSEIVRVTIDSWFNLVVRGDKVVELNGVRAITLGHNLVQGVLRHPYFGTVAVVNALKRYEGYGNGKLRITNPLRCERDAHGMIIRLF
jgi:hypothetical protein